MWKHRRQLLKGLVVGAAGSAVLPGLEAPAPAPGKVRAPATKIPVALIQCNSVPGQERRNLAAMERMSEHAAKAGARWILFPELTVCDYMDKPAEAAEGVPGGECTARMSRVSQRLGAFVGFGLVEKSGGSIYDSYVFTGPQGYIHHYRKTWLWYVPSDESYRDEWSRFDPGTGPEIFEFDGVRATCFICADSNSRRCVERAASLQPQVVLFPINRSKVSSYEDYAEIARKIKAPTLVPNRVGRSIAKDTMGGSVIYSPEGAILARANSDGREEILRHDLALFRDQK